MNLRKLANGKQCQVRIPGVCNFNPETTVLAHFRMAGITGGSQKAPDQLAAWCCSSCHDEVDGRTHNYILWHKANTDEKKLLAQISIDLMFLEGMARTQYILIQEGIIK